MKAIDTIIFVAEMITLLGLFTCVVYFLFIDRKLEYALIAAVTILLSTTTIKFKIRRR